MWELTVGTANAYHGKLIRNPKGLRPFKDLDVLLLQEVHSVRDKLSEELAKQTNLELVAFSDNFGLAIAINKKHEVVPDTFVEKVLQRRKRGATMLKQQSSLAYRMRARGVIGITADIYGIPITFATTHPNVPMWPPARRRQVRRIPNAIEDFEHPLWLGGDMNHFPGPRAVDRDMQTAARLSRADIEKLATWHTEGKWYSWLGKGAGLIRPSGIDGQLDSIYYRGPFDIHATKVIPMESDHDAIVVTANLVE